MDEPVVYFKPGCPFGIRLRSALTLHRVSHRSVRFRDDEDAAARVRDANDGNEISPTVHVAGRWLPNPGWREVRDLASTVRLRNAPDPDDVRNLPQLANPELAAPRHQPNEERPMNRSSVTMGVAITVAMTTTLLAACGSDDSARTGATPEGPASSAPASSAPASSAPTSEPAGIFDLEGTWQAGPISLKETEATIRRYGLGRYVEEYRENAPFFADTVLTLTIEDGAWDLYGEAGGGQPEPIDYDAEYEIDGDTVVFHHSDGSNTYRWEVDHDILRLHFVESTLPGYRGIPDEVFQRALYMTKTFTRLS